MADKAKYTEIDIQTLPDGQMAIGYRTRKAGEKVYTYEIEYFRLEDFSSFICKTFKCDLWRMPDPRFNLNGVMTEETDWQTGDDFTIIKINNQPVTCYVVGQAALALFLNKFSFGYLMTGCPALGCPVL